MEWATNNLAQSLLVLGLALLAIEVAVLGFATFVLFFVGVAATITALLLYLGLIPDTLLSALLAVALLTALTAVVLWKPLKKLQTNVDNGKAKNDLIGHRFVLNEEVSLTRNPVYRYSGIDWKLHSSDTLTPGTTVEVTQTDVGVFHIKAAQTPTN